MIDAQPGDGWIVPAAVAWALFEDAQAADEAMAAAEPLWDPRANGHGHGDARPVPGTGGDAHSGQPAASAGPGQRQRRPGRTSGNVGRAGTSGNVGRAGTGATAAAQPTAAAPGPDRQRHPRTGGNGSAGGGPQNGRRADNGMPEGNPWLRAARDGLADPVLARSSQQCFEAADAALGRAGAPADIRRRVAEFADRYVLRRRCPADDQLEGMQ